MRNSGNPAACGRLKKGAAAEVYAILSARSARTAKIPNSEFVMDMNYVGSKALDFIKTFLAYRRRYIIIVDFFEFYGGTVHYIVRNNVIVYS